MAAVVVVIVVGDAQFVVGQRRQLQQLPLQQPVAVAAVNGDDREWLQQRRQLRPPRPHTAGLETSRGHRDGTLDDDATNTGCNRMGVEAVMDAESDLVRRLDHQWKFRQHPQR